MVSRMLTGSVAVLATLIYAFGCSPAFAQERTYEIYVCKVGRCAGYQMPLAVAEVRNLHNAQWWRDLEIEVKNISDKPIYFIRLGVLLPDTTNSPNGLGGWGVSLRYGRPALIDIARHTESDDVPLKPGESYVFKIPENVQGTFSKRPEALTRRVLFRIDTINYGDGTGVVGGGAPTSRALP